MSRVLLLLGFFAIFVFHPLPASSEQGNPPPVKGFLEIARDPSASAAQKKTIAAVIRSVSAKNADEAYHKVMAGDQLLLYGGDSDFLTDISPLASFTNLKTLVLYHNRISDITPLSALTNLQALRLELNRISDIAPLRALQKLESLQIDDNQISDVRPLAGLIHLRTLWITRNKVRDVSPLASLSALRDLYLSGNPVGDLAPLVHLSISDLRLNECGLEDVSALRDLNQKIVAFINLDLSKNRIRNVEPLAHLDQVSDLQLGDNEITDISALARSKFAHLDLHNNKIADIGALAHSEFKTLDLRSNQITDISALATLSPQTVDVRNNPIKDFQPLIALLGAHPGTEIHADHGFDRALSASVPARPELAKSPLIGRWRCDPFDSGEFGVLAVVIRLEANGLCHLTLYPPSLKDENASPLGTHHGRFSVTKKSVSLHLDAGDGEVEELQIDGQRLLLKWGKLALTFKKVGVD